MALRKPRLGVTEWVHDGMGGVWIDSIAGVGYVGIRAASYTIIYLLLFQCKYILYTLVRIHKLLFVIANFNSNLSLHNLIDNGSISYQMSSLLPPPIIRELELLIMPGSIT